MRIECRVGGADLNPHLAYAALIAAGIAGIERELELEPEFSGDAYAARGCARSRRPCATRPRRCAVGDAARRLRRRVIDHYVHAARWEQAECDRRVTDWELARGFERA